MLRAVQCIMLRAVLRSGEREHVTAALEASQLVCVGSDDARIRVHEHDGRCLREEVGGTREGVTRMDEGFEGDETA